MQVQTTHRGNCSTLVGKSRGGTPFCRMRKTVFPKSSVSHETIECPLQLFPRNSCKMSVSDSDFTRRGGLVRPASKSGRFSHHPFRVPKTWHRDFAACGQRSGLLALNLANIFEKLLDQKTFYSPAARDWKPNLKNNLLRKCGLLASTSPAFLKKLLEQKTFYFQQRFPPTLYKIQNLC